MLAVLLLTATPALADERFTDPGGDVRGGPGPDIISVVVSQPDTGKVSIAVEFAADPPLGVDVVQGSTDMLLVLLDTGEPSASAQDADYATGVHGANLTESVGTGAPLRDLRDLRDLREQPDMTGDYGIRMGIVGVAVAGRTVTLTIPLDAIGNPDRVDFVLGTGREGPEGASGGSDGYPDEGWQTYLLAEARAGPPAIPWPALGAGLVWAVVIITAIVVLRRRGHHEDASPPDA
jgi:hypothetical protein